MFCNIAFGKSWCKRQHCKRLPWMNNWNCSPVLLRFHVKQKKKGKKFRYDCQPWLKAQTSFFFLFFFILDVLARKTMTDFSSLCIFFKYLFCLMSKNHEKSSFVARNNFLFQFIYHEGESSIKKFVFVIYYFVTGAICAFYPASSKLLRAGWFLIW